MIVLGSTSKYREELLSRLHLPFSTAKPVCDESPQPSEAPEQLAQRLAQTKAESLRNQHPKSIIIGSDQVAALGSKVLGKPGTIDRACEQLRAMRGKSVVFYTAVTVLDAQSSEYLQAIDQTTATLRDLTEAEIERYVHAEKPLDCAGSFLVEKRGISLFESIETTDPTALIGLPMIKLCQFLRQFGIQVP